jgi:thymidylate synthase
MPTLTINSSKKNVADFVIDDFELVNYEAHDAIKAPIAV